MTTIRSVAAVLVLTFGVVRISAAQEPLEHIPASADLVLRLKAPQQTTQKVASLAEAVKPGSGEMGRQSASNSKLGEAIRVPDLAGVDQMRDWYIVLAAKPEGRPDVFYAIPTTDANALTAALPERMVARVEEDWVIYTGTADAIPDPAEPGSGISSVMSAESAAVFARGDLSLFINTMHLREVYARQIAAGKEQIDALLQQIAAAASQANGMNMEAIMDMYGTMIRGAFQALEDSRGCSVAVVFGEDGLQIEKHVAFAAGSPSAQTLAAHPTSTMESLARLPGGAAGYFGMHGNMQQLIEWGWSVNAGMLAGDEQQKQRFEDAKQQWREIEFGDIVGAFQLGSADGGLFRYMAIVEAAPTQKVRDSMREMSDLFAMIETPGMTQEMTIQPDAETIGSHNVDRITVKQTIDPNLDPTGMQQKMQEMMFGPDGMISRVAYLDGFYVQTMGGGREAMESLLAAVDKAPREDLARYREGLSTDSNLLVLLDLPALAVSGLTIAGTLPDVTLPMDARALSEVELETSYLGYTLASEEDALRVRVNIPVEQFRGIVSLVELFQQSSNQ